MGVPKFYRWMSERYPCLSETVKEFQIPEFDNLYLDMNGIIHVCSHPEDDNPHFRITEEKIFSDIMHYLEFLFRMIKPRKVFFMAVDGVAPRAKMNQQRGRRFRSAREAEELEKKAKEKGETLPSEKRFDSNCITPGTAFMVRLQEQLKYFVVKKLSTDPLWQGVRVYLSGHETPGEGEHKIMDFIRAERVKPSYDPNTRHVLHGLDADLMMLGLATHEPHFSLLREEVRFGGRKDRSNKRPVTPEETTFHLLHLSLFREYLDFEFSALKTKLPFPYDLERVIDDWVLMGFLVGNDFIPHLPNLHINHDALPLLWQTYIDTLPSCSGYINEGGYLNLEIFETYLAALSKFDFDTFSEQVGDLKWLEGKKGNATAEKAEMLSAARKFRKNAKKQENHFAVLLDLPQDNMDGFLGLDGTDGSNDDEFSEDISQSDSDSEDTLDDEFRHHKRAYYMDKLEYEKVTPEVLRDQAEGYVRGIQWILLYYYEGVPSWSWYYPHHYAPYMSDVKDFKHMDFKFDLGTPFMPFEQLMAVLPAASKELLPQAYRSLMTTDSSPVIDFYPVDFSTDLNGKQQDWEAVVLIPFIDENRLLNAMRAAEVNLTPEERGRNRHGPCCLYEYTADTLDMYPSSLPDAFPDILMNHARLTEIPKYAFWLKSSELVKGLLKGVKLDVFFPGFPTLKHIPHKAELKKEGVKVFQMNSRGYNVMLQVDDQGVPDIQKVAREYLGKEIYVGWPHLYEAKVVAVCNDEVSHSLVESAPVKGSKSSQQGAKTNIRVERCDDNIASLWYREVNSLKDRYKDRLGVLVGDTHVLLRALPMTGRKYVFGSHGRITMSKQFGNQPAPFLLQTSVKDIAVHDPSFCQFKTLKEYLPEGQPAFMLGWPHYGCQGEVMEVDMESGRVRLSLTIFEEPRISGVMNNQQMHDERYIPGYVAAQRLGVSSQLFGRMTGTILVCQGEAELAREQQNPHKVNIGLNLKFTKRGEEIPGYTRLKEGQWSYAEKTVQIAREYMAKFPEMWKTVSNTERSHNDIFYESELIPKHCDYKLQSVSEYIKSLPCYGLKSMKSGADIISEGVIKALEAEADKIVEMNKKRQKRVKMQVKPHLLFRPLPTAAAMIPDSTATYKLFDRVVNIRQGYSVPFGLRGTVVGVHPSEVEMNSVFEVLFDEEFQGSISIRNSTSRGYRMPPSSLLNLTHGERKNGIKPAVSTQPPAQTSGGYGQQNRHVTSDHSYAAASQSGYHRNQGGYQGQQGGYQNQNRAGPQDSFYPQWSKNQSERGRQNQTANHRPADTGPQDNTYPQWSKNQSEWSRQNKLANQKPTDAQYDQKKAEPRQQEQLAGKVFNGGTSQPKFVTPRVSSGGGGQRRPSQGENQPPQESLAGNSEFENMWKQLQSSMPAGVPETSGSKPSSEGTSLAQAATALPPGPSTSTPAKPGDKTNNNNAEQGTGQKIDVQSLFSQAGKTVSLDEDKNVKEEKEKDQKGGKSKVVSNDEFAAMFKSLSEVQLSDGEEEKEEIEAPETEDGSEMIKKMLNINSEEESVVSSSSEPVNQPRANYGRQVSIQELFEGAKKQQEQTPADKGQQKGAQPEKKGQGTKKAKQQQQQESQAKQMYGLSKQQQQQQYQQQQQNQRPSLLMPPSKGGNRNPVMELMSFCQSLQLGLPMYDYMTKGGQHYCVVTLFNGQRFSGSVCKTREEAAESAAGVALLQLKGGMHQMSGHPMMRMPGFVPPGVLPQGRQFSSPNSAFSPVNTFTGGYQNQGQNSHGHFQNPQQRPYGRGSRTGNYGNQTANYGSQAGGNYGNQGGGNYGNQGGGGNHGNQASNQHYQSSGRQQQQHPPSSNANQANFKKKEEDSSSQAANQKQAGAAGQQAANQRPAGAGSAGHGQGEGKTPQKTQPTCVVNPFVPLQVTKKQTPVKGRKESSSEDSPPKPDEKVSRLTPADTGENRVQSKPADSEKVHDQISQKPVDLPKNSKDSVSDVKEKTPPRQDQVKTSDGQPDSAKKPATTPGSTKKPKRRLAANFNFK